MNSDNLSWRPFKRIAGAVSFALRGVVVQKVIKFALFVAEFTDPTAARTVGALDYPEVTTIVVRFMSSVNLSYLSSRSSNFTMH